MKKIYLLFVFTIVSITAIYAQCTEIESILVDACGTPEGKNEMFRFRVGPNNLNTSNLSVTWDSNPWLGVCQNSTTARDVTALNRTILNCGWLVEPVGGVLPAGREILFITSENMDTLANSFANLEDTLIVVFQCGNASSGHFRNYATGVGTRTTVLTFSGANGCSTSVTYEPDHLVGQNGTHTLDDGALVNFTNSIPSSYTNNGCNAPIPVMSVQILTPNTTVCKGAPVSLQAIAANYKNVKWKGGQGSFSYADSLNTVYTPSANDVYPITLTIKAYKKCTGDSLSDQITISKYTNSTTAGGNVAVCSGNSATLTATGGTSYAWDASPYLSCTGCASPVASPASTSTFFANVTDNHTCVNRDSVRVTVNPNDTIIVNGHDTICTGGSISLAAFSNNGYAWTPSTNLSCTNCANPSASPSSSLTYTLTSLGVCPAQKQVYVHVLLPNVVSISNTGSVITCATNSITLTASSIASGLSYNWGSGITGTLNIITGGGTYTVTATDTHFGCSATANAVITQNTTAPNASIAAHGSLTCAVGNITLTATSATTGAGYNWGNGNVSANYSVSAAGNYTVTVTDPANGCTATATTGVTAVGNTISLTASSTDATCGNNNGSATTVVSSGTPNYTYSWNTGSVNSSLANLTTGAYSVTVTDANGCSSSASVNVAATGSLNLTSSFTNTSCGLNNGTAQATAASGTSPYIFSWSNSGSSSSLTGLSSGTYTVTVSDVNSCSATASITIASSSVNPVTVSTNNAVICASDSSQLCATSGFTSYQWNNGKTGSCVFANQAGNYYVTATDQNNCTVESNHLPLVVHPLPPVSISVNGDTLSAYNSVTYQWYFNNNPVIGATHEMLIATQSGIYSVVVTDANGCMAISNPIVINITGITGEAPDRLVNIYPNPAKESEEWILDTGEKNIGSNCELYDAAGKLIYSAEINTVHSEINLPLAKGVYMLNIFNSQTRYTTKLVKW